MGIVIARSATPGDAYRSITGNGGLIFGLIRREVVGRYRGSVMGLFWSLFNPLLMLAVYTFVFSVVFKARWGGGSGSKTEFALVLFSGLMIFNLFAECVNRAPTLVLSNANYVKKVVFPLEILPLVVLGSALFHLAVSFVVWLAFYLCFFGLPPVTILLLPLVLIPYVLIILGVCWVLASLSVYLRDVAQVVGVFTTIMMFMSPIFYPVDALPEEFRAVLLLNPLTFIVEQARAVMIWNHGINWTQWGAYTLASLVVAWAGFAWFQKTRRGFADVL